jgi:hypothetical protein
VTGLLRYDEGLLVLKIDAFHAYVHAGVCRWLMNIRGTEDAGYCDGGGDERLWSEIMGLAGPASRMVDANYTDMIAHTFDARNDRWVDNPVVRACHSYSSLRVHIYLISQSATGHGYCDSFSYCRVVTRMIHVVLQTFMKAHFLYMASHEATETIEAVIAKARSPELTAEQAQATQEAFDGARMDGAPHHLPHRTWNAPPQSSPPPPTHTHITTTHTHIHTHTHTTSHTPGKGERERERDSSLSPSSLSSQPHLLLFPLS